MKMKVVFLAILLLSFGLVSTARADNIVIPGTGDGVAMLQSIGDAFTEKTSVVVEIPPSIGSGSGIKAAGKDKVKLARVGRALKEGEQHFGLTYTPIFHVPTVFFVHEDVSVDNITAQQVLDIFSGKIENWQEVGGSDNEIYVIRREDGDSSLINLHNTFPGFKDITLTNKSLEVTKTPIMVTQIQSREQSIGWGPYDVALANNLKVLKIDGIGPDDKNYPYFGTIGLVYKGNNLSGSIKDFVEFAVYSGGLSAEK